MNILIKLTNLLLSLIAEMKVHSQATQKNESSWAFYLYFLFSRLPREQIKRIAFITAASWRRNLLLLNLYSSTVNRGGRDHKAGLYLVIAFEAGEAALGSKCVIQTETEMKEHMGF